MILTCITLVIIILLALYLSAQGVFSGVLLFASALFGSMLAIGMYEWLSPWLDGWRPDFSNGVMFLIVFLFGFSGVRLLADHFLRENILLPKWVDKIGGGLLGALAGMVIVGTAMTGFEMLPLPESIGGTAEIQNDAPPGSANRLMSANFVTGLYYLASGRSLGGVAISQAHPDLSAELTGYRHGVYLDDRTSLDPSLIKVSNWYELTAERAKSLGADGDFSKPLLVVRSTIERGGDPPKSSYFVSDKGEVLGLSATQVRLVAVNDRGETRQYYPVGILERGDHFKELPVGTGYTIDDYAASKVNQDWVFAVDDGETPQFIEFKRGGRVSLADKESKTPLSPLASVEYPPHGWDAGTATLEVTVKIDGKPATQAMVFRVNSIVRKDKIADTLAKASELLAGNAEESRPTENIRIRLANASPDTNIDWREVAQIILQSQSATKVPVDRAWQYYTGPMKKAMEDSGTLREAININDGKGEGRVPGGNYILVAVARTDTLLEAWIKDLDWDPAKATSTEHKVEVHIDSEPLIIIDQKKL